MDFTPMENVLIDEVRQRPSIYDKTQAVYKNSRIREREWKEVAQAVNVKDVEAVKKRWRSLRDSFIKIQRMLKHNPKQVIKWLYYKKMMFLIPYIESKEISLGESGLKNEDDDGTQDAAQADTDSGIREDFRYVPDDVSFPEATPSKPELKKPKRSHGIDEDPLLSSISSEPDNLFVDGSTTKRKRPLEDDLLVPTVKEPDPDEQFLLSCLPALKRLHPRENAIARLKIQQVLFEVEFGNTQNGFVTKEEDVEYL